MMSSGTMERKVRGTKQKPGQFVGGEHSPLLVPEHDY